MGVVVRELSQNDEEAFLEGAKEWEGESTHWYSFAWQRGISYQEMLALLEKEAAGIDLAPGRVPHTMLYAFLKGKIIGRVNIRHSLNDLLKVRGGHIGYAVAPRYRRKGYATEIVRQALERCRHLGLREVMITCADSNIPSWKIIERFGGKLDEQVWDEGHQEMIRKYWLKLSLSETI